MSNLLKSQQAHQEIELLEDLKDRIAPLASVSEQDSKGCSRYSKEPKKEVQKKRERVLIWIKDLSDLTLLPQVAAIQAYADDAKKKHEGWSSVRDAISDYTVSMDLILPPKTEQFDFIFRILIPSVASTWYGGDATYTLPEEIGIDYDCILDLEESKARAIGLPTGKHLAQSYGIMLGGEALHPHSIENLCQSFTNTGKILTSLEFLKIVPPLSLIRVSETVFSFRDDKTIEERIQQVFECDAVMDVCSFETHLASCLNKPVLEYSRDFALTKWSNPNYYLITEMNEDAFKRGLTLWQPRLLQECSIEMEPEISIALDAKSSSVSCQQKQDSLPRSA